MKVEFRDQKDSSITYPCLKRNKITGAIVLFSSATEGTFLCSGTGNRPVGYYSKEFCPNYFEVLSESCEVILKN